MLLLEKFKVINYKSGQRGVINLRMFSFFVFVLILSVFFLSLAWWLLVNISYGEATVVIKGEQIKAEVARSMAEKVKGLSGRESLDKDKGMLFLYDNYKNPGFVMRDMNFPIDIIWIRDDQVVGIEHNALPESYGEGKIFYPPEPVNLILEVNAGTAIMRGWEKGDVVEVRYR